MIFIFLISFLDVLRCATCEFSILRIFDFAKCDVRNAARCAILQCAICDSMYDFSMAIFRFSACAFTDLSTSSATVAGSGLRVAFGLRLQGHFCFKFLYYFLVCRVENFDLRYAIF
jgi:hypothetical protein